MWLWPDLQYNAGGLMPSVSLEHC
eukprot:COSAG02_NODE_21933_length_769_cov_20.940299_1_plen_23_part_10